MIKSGNYIADSGSEYPIITHEQAKKLSLEIDYPESGTSNSSETESETESETGDNNSESDTSNSSEGESETDSNNEQYYVVRCVKKKK